jgi:hypothetical protein
MKPEVHKLRVNVKSLMAEARFIREEIRLAKTMDAKNELAVHRMTRVKPEARLAQLALAFVKSVPYKVVEQRTNRPVQSIELIQKVRKFVYPVKEQEVKEWLCA